MHPPAPFFAEHASVINDTARSLCEFPILKPMTEKTYLKLTCLLSQAKFEARRSWLDAWQMWPGARPLPDLMDSWARELRDLNDAHAELDRIYRSDQ